jgi:hypothetical protein
MGFSSDDQLLAALTAGQYLRREASKLTAPVHTAGGWHLLAGLGGYPNAATYPGTSLLWANCEESVGDGTTVIGMLNGGPPGGSATKHLLNVGAMLVAATGAPWQAKLVDLQGYYPLTGTDVTGTSSRSLINSNTFTATSSGGLLLTYTNDFKSMTKVRFTTTTTLPTGLSLSTDYWLVRASASTAHVSKSYANALASTFVAYTDAGTGTHTMTIQMPRYANGVGCQAFFCVNAAPTAGGPTLSASDYSNTVPTSGRAFQGSVVLNAAANAYATRILHSGNAAGNYGPFLPLQGGDLGIARINSFTLSAGTAYTGSGTLTLCIAKPLMDLALPVTGMWCERDLRNQLPSMPQIQDGACLAWMLFGTGATTTASPFNSTLDFAWN